MLKSSSLPALVIKVSWRWLDFQGSVESGGADRPVRTWPQSITLWPTVGLADLQSEMRVQHDTIGDWSPVTLEETQHSQRKSWHLSFTAKDIGKELLGGWCLYPGSDSFSSILCSSQDQSKLQNSWRRKIQPWLGATLVRHHSNRLSRKSVESCYNNVQHIFMGQRRCRLYCKKA